MTTRVLFQFAVYTEFENLMHDQAPIEAYIDWIESMIHRCVIQVGTVDIV